VAFTDRDLQVADQASAGTTGRGGEAGQAIAGTAGSGAAKPPGDVSHPAYMVPEWVRVRPEDFGLLFYDTRSTRLTFVRSGDSLVPPSFTGPRRVLSVRAGAAPGGPALSRLLDDLVVKGLLVAAEVE
jgi:putative mycofactocin binding protein MftB